MFTGIIESSGIITVIEKGDGYIHYTVESPVSRELKVDQSVAHDGVCLTVTYCDETCHKVTAVEETLQKTNLREWQAGRRVNLERAMKLGDRLDGHIVQGHVDTTGSCTSFTSQEGNRLYSFRFPEAFAALVIEKGSICINGVSLTAFNVGKDTFSVTIIPYTYGHTSFSDLQEGENVNLEFDILGKYFLRQQEVHAFANT